jgi:DNA-binding transcriptional LysR family regulator
VELRHVRYFIAVAEELNFTRAAEKLNVSQPPLSRQIKELEEEVGIQLFARDHRGVFLTPAGEIFLREARQLIAQAERAMESVRPFAKEEGGIIRVGLGAGLSVTFAPIFLAHEKRFSAVDIRCKDILSGHQSHALRNQLIDIGIMRPPVEPQHLISEFLFQEGMFVLLPRSSPLAKHKTLRLRDIANQTLLLQERHYSSGTYEKCVAMFRNASLDPKIIQTDTGAHEEAGTMLVAAGKGIFLIPAMLAHRCIAKEVIAIELAEPQAVFEVHMAWRRNEKSPLVLELLRTVRNNWANNPTSNNRHTFRA